MLFVLMTIACICRGDGGRASLTPDIQINLANPVNAYTFLSKPTLLDDKRPYDNRDTGKVYILQGCRCFYNNIKGQEIR